MDIASARHHHVQLSLRHDLELDAVVADVDGDYVVAASGVAVIVTVGESFDPPLVRVWAVAATGVRKSLAVLTELNAANLDATQLRLLLNGDAVIASGELVLDSIEPGELGHLVEQVGATARHLGELLTTVHGGALPWAVAADDNADRR